MAAMGIRLRILIGGMALIAGSAFAQTPNATQTPTQIAPAVEPTAPAETLSDRLNRSNDVIHPKEVDPAIEKPAPQARDPNLLPPPGTSGGAPAPQPK